jgi:hypothetical protein
MKRSIQGVIAVLILWAAPVPARAGLLDWFVSQSADWKTIQSTGGIRVLTPVTIGGKLLLPVLYDASGMSNITCEPTVVHTGVVVDKIKVSQSGTNIVIRVTTCLRKDMGSTVGDGRYHYADLSGIPPGSYQIFYGRADDPAAVLGQIVIK